MPSTPYMKLYIGDYLGDTSHLTTLQHGAYLLLIMAYWQRKGPLPADDDKLARITRCTPEEWLQCKSDTLAFFEERDGMLYHHRIERELDNVESVSAKRSDAARKKWAQNAHNDAIAEQMDTTSDANDMLSHIHSHSHIPEEEKKEEKQEFFHLSQKPIPIQNDGTSRIERARTAWNTLAPLIGPECRLMAIQFKRDDLDDCLRIMSVYSDDEIAEAIQNYCNLKTDSEYDPPRYGGFVGFMRGGVEKFISAANPQDIFKKRKGFETAGEREDRERAEALRRLGVEP